MKLRTSVAGFVVCSVAPTPTFAGDYTDPAVSVVVGSESNPTLNQPTVVYSGSNTAVVLKDDRRHYHEERPWGGIGYHAPCAGVHGKPNPCC